MRFRRVAVLLVLVLAAPLALAQQTKTSNQTPPVTKATVTPKGKEKAPPPPTAAEPKMTADSALTGDPQAGASKVAVCSACHGPSGNSSDAQYPKLAGQNESYIVTSLRGFKSGRRKNAIMAGFAAQLSNQDMHDIGAYYAQQTTSPGVADQSVVKTGQALYRQGDPTRDIPACMACHGPDGAGNPGAGYPHLAGQHAPYVQQVLKAWHDGDSWGKSEHEQIMPTIASRLTSQDIIALASYVEGLHAVTPAQQGTASAP